MPSPSQLSIATSAVNRLLKEEVTYRKELAGQEQRLTKLQNSTTDDDGNREFSLEQEKKSIDETKAVFGPLRERIEASTEKLGQVLAESDDTTDSKEIEAAKEALEKGRGQ